MSGKVMQDLFTRARVPDLVGQGAWDSARRDFTGPAFEAWIAAVETLIASGIGSNALVSFVRNTPLCARIVGTDAALALAPSAIAIMSEAGAQPAVDLLSVAPRAAQRLENGETFREWLSVIEELAALAPESVGLVLERTGTILARLRPAGLRAWVLAGIRNAGDDPDKRIAYFSLSDPGALRVVEQEAGDVLLGTVERSLKAYLAALWRLRPLVRPAKIDTGFTQAPRRTSFDESLVRLPETFRGVTGRTAVRLFHAAIAHVGAHMMFTPDRFAVGT